MDRSSAPFAAALLEASRSALAAGAARRLVEREPELAARWAPRAYERWRESLDARLRDLAAALDSRDPAHFTAQVRWARTAFRARSLPVEDLARALSALREELRSELPAAARTEVDGCLAQALEALAREDDAPPETLDASTPAGRLAARYLERLLHGERAAAFALVEDALARAELTPLEALVDLLGPAVRQLGRAWHTGELGVADEHLGTASSRTLAERVVARAPRVAPLGKRVLAAATTGDAHDFGLTLVGLVFELDGWELLPLGADVPAGELGALAARLEPELVLLSATLGWQRQAAARSIAALRAHCRAPILVGGAAFPDEGVALAAGAVAWAPDARAALALGRALVGLPPH